MVGPTVSDGAGVVRLLDKEPTAAERYAHASALMALINKPRPAATCTASAVSRAAPRAS